MAEPSLIRKNARGDHYRVAVETYEGSRFVDLRVYYTAPDGELKPTKKGVAISLASLPQVAGALLKIAAETSV